MDIRQDITDKIISALEQGILPWKCPLEKASLPINFKTKHLKLKMSSFLIKIQDK